MRLNIYQKKIHIKLETKRGTNSHKYIFYSIY